jgi:hypothetical protein
MRTLAVSLSVMSLSLLGAVEADSAYEEASLLQVKGRDNFRQRGDPVSSTSRDEVLAVWDSMRSMWPHPGPALQAGCNINMDMRDNTMTMDGTSFTFPQRSSLLLQDSNVDVGELATKEVDFGPLRLSKNMKGNLMTMKGSSTKISTGKIKTDELTVLEDMQQVGSLLEMDAKRQGQENKNVPASDQNLYMYNSQLSMDGTYFTMNVGTGTQSQGTGLLETRLSSEVTLDALNINMYMHDNRMSMKGTTEFTMDVNSASKQLVPDDGTTVSEAGVAAADLARLVLLSISSFREAAQDNSILQKPAESNELKSIWSWLETWTGGSAGDNSLDINMYMYDNEMTMDKTQFAMRVGGPALVLAENSKESFTTGSAAGASASMTPVAGSQAQDMYLYDAQYSMRDTQLTFDVGNSLLETQSNRTSSGTQVNMYMYKNSMQMQDTIFNFNVGSGAQGLLQKDAENVSSSTKRLQKDAENESSSTRRMQVMNVNSLNINMYMLENDMSMTNTKFTWNLS